MSKIELFNKLVEKYSLIPVNGKQPIGKGWTRWCSEKSPFNPSDFENCNAGIACGPASGVLVLDVDDVERFAELAKESQWEVPETMTVQTGGGGRHYYYAYPDDGCEYQNKSFKVPEGGVFDVRGLGGAVVAPGSIHPDTGNVYSLLNDLEPASAPAWLLDYSRRQGKPASENAGKGEAQPSPVAPIVNVDVSELRLPKATKQLIQSGAPKGTRSDQQWSVIMELLRADYGDDTIVAVFEKYAIGEKYRSKGAGRVDWLKTDIERARAELAKAPRRGGNSPENLLDIIKPYVQAVIRDGSNCYVRCLYDGKLMTLDMTSSDFSGLICRLYYNSQKTIPFRHTVDGVVKILKWDYLRDENESKVYLRFARVGEKVYLDLADNSWSVVEISADGWQVLPQSPVPMWRSQNMRPLPIPVEGGSLEELRTLLYCPDDDTWSLIKGALLGAVKPDGPYFLLNILGSPGAGKSCLAKLLKQAIDPSVNILGGFPASPRDLMVTARNDYLLPFDNLSNIPHWASDALCRVASGTSSESRSLYTNGDSYVIKAARPVILTGINSVIRKSDLADRTITIELPPMPERSKKREAEIMRCFEEMHPRVLGAVCTAISNALANESRVELPANPRMLDASIWISAAEYDPDNPRYDFLDAYLGNRQEVAADLIRENPEVQAVLEFMASRDSNVWTGSPTQLLAELRSREVIPENGISRLPSQPNGLTSQLNICKPILKDRGIDYVNKPSKNSRLVTLTKTDVNRTAQQTENVTDGEENLSNDSGLGSVF